MSHPKHSKSVSEPGFEPGTSWLQALFFNHWTTQPPNIFWLKGITEGTTYYHQCGLDPYCIWWFSFFTLPKSHYLEKPPDPNGSGTSSSEELAGRSL
ncbi:UNVERIFIED_CONTAM: hypothetical protein FKN15_022770 [Acipenser sinensis]